MARNVSESPVRHRHSPRRSRREECLQSRRSSRSPSPRTKRLRRAQGEREEGRRAGKKNHLLSYQENLRKKPTDTEVSQHSYSMSHQRLENPTKDGDSMFSRMSYSSSIAKAAISLDVRKESPTFVLIILLAACCYPLPVEVEMEKLDGMMETQVRPYIMDLGSTNKTLASMFLLFHIYCDPLLTERGWLFLVMRSIFTLKAAASLDFGPNIKVTHRDRAEISQNHITDLLAACSVENCEVSAGSKKLLEL
ncbi:hypothetical protein F2Q70_00036904 [Brassica cretica]|uniref:Uncharacterized protein n=1 Tax=Brassica cretica TaxID=69181 RepID=A0A8S9GA56_BRACR|nr:hypothetical protein F2Q68_00032246 [Brassica cretica]KAF2584081.1 hypothetical protein F2Q70_00036904 [Brassica cretica]